MAKILTPLLRKLPTLSSTKLMLRCKSENGLYFEKECKPEKEGKPQKECIPENKCNAEKDCSVVPVVPVQNTSATSSTLITNSCEPVLDDRRFEAPGSAIVATDVLWHQCHQCHETLSMTSVTQSKPVDRNNPPEVPTNCCMLGCPNCVWLQFAEDMMEYSVNGNADARKLIEEIADQNLKTFLLLELDNMQK